jgi:hypothetical protein
VVERDHPSHLTARCVQLALSERSTVGRHLNHQPCPVLTGGDPDRTLVPAVKAEGHPHHAVEGRLVLVPEPHQGDLAQVVRARDVEHGALRHVNDPEAQR